MAEASERFEEVIAAAELASLLELVSRSPQYVQAQSAGWMSDQGLQLLWKHLEMVFEFQSPESVIRRFRAGEAEPSIAHSPLHCYFWDTLLHLSPCVLALLYFTYSDDYIPIERGFSAWMRELTNKNGLTAPPWLLAGLFTLEENAQARKFTHRVRAASLLHRLIQLEPRVQTGGY
jgi:hypothetical protein